MRRVLSVFLPQWPVERLRRARRLREPRAVLLTAAVAAREVVTAASPGAQRRGVRAGMPLADARALLDQPPLVAPAQPERDRAGLEALARWALRWSPITHPDAPDGLLLDITGCTHLFGGERGLVNALHAGLAALGFTARIGAASTIGAAWALARLGPREVTRIAPDGARAALAPLPVECLRLEPAAAAGLREVGVTRVEHLLALPRAGLPARYGPGVLRRLDQALGDADERVGVLPEAPAYCAWFDLPGGSTDLEVIQEAVRRALDDLARQLEAREVGLRRLTVRFTRLDAEEIALSVHVTRPSRDAGHLARLLRPRVERVHLGFGVECVTLEAGEPARLPFEQGTLLRASGGRGPDDAAFAHALDAIANRLGRGRLYRAVLHESYRPERAGGFVPLNTDNPPAAFRARARPPAGPRPTRLLEQPAPLHAMALSPDGPVLALGDGAGGTRPVRASLGPERIGGEWWRAREGTRDYFRVQDDAGRWLWIFREHAGGGWFVHGEWA